MQIFLMVWQHWQHGGSIQLVFIHGALCGAHSVRVFEQVEQIRSIRELVHVTYGLSNLTSWFLATKQVSWTEMTEKEMLSYCWAIASKVLIT